MIYDYLKDSDNAKKINQNSLIDLMNKLVDENDLTSFLNALLNNDLWLSQICANSYIHYNGFDKLTLFSGKKINLRLHIYWSKKDRINENIHSHRWAYCSKIILGSYTSYIYQIDSNSSNYFEYRYHSVQESNKYSLDFVGKIGLKLVETKKHAVGMLNFGEPNELHRIQFDNSVTTATLFVTTKYRKDCAIVINENEIAAIENIPATKLTIAEVRTKIKKLIFELEKNYL